MFEQPAGKVEKDRSRLIMIVSAVAVVVVIGLIVLVGALGGREPEKVQMAGPGSAEFDAYAPYVQISDIEKREGERVTSKYGRIICLIRNSGDKVLTGLQVRGAAIGLNDQVITQRVVNIVPGQKEALYPNGMIDVDLYLEPIPDPSQVKDMTIEITGLKVQ